MQMDVDMAGRRVVVVGAYRAARRVLRRYAASEARVTAVVSGPLPAAHEVPPRARIVAMPSLDDMPDWLRLVGPAFLVATVGLSPDETAAIRGLAERLRILCTDEPAAAESGHVTLVGGGPGSTGLLTLAACAALREADVICYDRLAPSDDLGPLAPGAELIDVGKTPYHHRISQNRIEDLLIARARRGEAVVRLKGGDPFVFGRGSEEVQACAAAGITVRVVPGVSSAIAVPAAAGIPLTHRGVSHAFTVISGHVLPTAEEFAGLTALGGSIVILMGVANLTGIAAGLRGAGMAEGMPAAIVERGFSDSQRTTHTTLARLADDARRLDIASPAVIVVGEVVRLGAEVSAQLPLCVLDPVPRG